MRPDLLQVMLEAIAAVYEAESDPQGPHTAQTLKTTPSPVALSPHSPSNLMFSHP